MKLYHVLVEQDDDWFIGRVLEREGITTQGRSLDELIFMVRDAIGLMWNEKGVQLELVVPGGALTAFDRKAARLPKHRPAKPTWHAAKRRIAAIK
jgi:predicted RNase H-like HicB family nuclease